MSGLLPPTVLALALSLASGVAFSADEQGQAARTDTRSVVPPGSRNQTSEASARPVRVDSRPAWAELTTQQQIALLPLSSHWNSLTEAHKRKWIALSANWHKMPAAEQAKLHSRMNEWSALSPQQRAVARLNFAEAKELSTDDRKAKWEAYQALTPEEKHRLATGAPVRTSPTAAPVRPVPPQKLARVPAGAGESRPPRIATGAPSEVAPSGPASPVGQPH